MRIVRYTPMISNNRRIVHPSWALTNESFHWKINIGDTVVLKLKEPYQNINDLKFKVSTLTIEQAKPIIEKYKAGMTLNQDGEIVKKDNSINTKKWNDVIDFEKEFTFSEINMISNADIIIDRRENMSDEQKVQAKMIMNTIDKFYQKAISASKEIWSTDSRLQEVMIILNDLGFLTASRVNEIMRTELIKEDVNE